MFVWSVTFRHGGRHEVINPTAKTLTEAVTKAVSIGVRDNKLPPDTDVNAIYAGTSAVMLYGCNAVQEVHE